MDCPAHYFRGGIGEEEVGREMTKVKGGYLLKERLLEKQGYKVLHIPYFEWYELNSANEKKDYLKRMFRNEGQK